VLKKKLGFKNHMLLRWSSRLEILGRYKHGAPLERKSETSRVSVFRLTIRVFGKDSVSISAYTHPLNTSRFNAFATAV
jgi:hypothetical protein